MNLTTVMNEILDVKIDTIITTLKNISGQIFFLNFMLIMIFFTGLGTENVNVVNSSINVKTETKDDTPILYCSGENIFYFQSTYTVVVDDKNKPKKCDEKNTTYKYDSYYKDYRKY